MSDPPLPDLPEAAARVSTGVLLTRGTGCAVAVMLLWLAAGRPLGAERDLLRLARRLTAPLRSRMGRLLQVS